MSRLFTFLKDSGHLAKARAHAQPDLGQQGLRSFRTAPYTIYVDGLRMVK
jgi:hypothetical protein